MTLRIYSMSAAQFRDRREAGRLLAGKLDGHRGRSTVIVGIPRGGVVIADEMALVLDAQMDILLAHKIGALNNPELAIGAITEDEHLVVNERISGLSMAEESYIDGEKQARLSELIRRRDVFRADYPKRPLSGKTVIVTDDGVATGATALAAVLAVRRQKPKKVIAAFPVGVEESLRRLEQDADEVVCLRAPEPFFSIGQFYEDFTQVTDEEVLQILRSQARKVHYAKP